MDALNTLLKKIEGDCENDFDNFDIVKARKVINNINEFLYTTDYSLGTTRVFDEDVPYFSKFHKYWEENHKEILNLKINEAQCEKVADSLHDVFIRTNGKAFSEVWNTYGLNKEDVCRIRLLTANQDFRGSRDFGDLVKIFNDDPTIFDENYIFNNPDDFLKSIKLSDLSQNDKRISYAKNISRFIIENSSTPIDIISKFDNDLYAFRIALINSNGAGYGNKKTDMFIRDMIVLKIWDNCRNFDKIDVASDVNTIKVALRTGILESEIPLVSSFLDIFCYQYSYVDNLNAQAWRKVWEIWRKKYPNETINSPCLLDYFIYMIIGKQMCKENLYTYKCERGHIFKWHSSRNKTCQICYQNSKTKVPATKIESKMACMDSDQSVAIKNTEFYKSGIATPNYEKCPFSEICNQHNRKDLDAPKSISILGKTGWSSAYSKSGSGGGGLMA